MSTKQELSATLRSEAPKGRGTGRLRRREPGERERAQRASGESARVSTKQELSATLRSEARRGAAQEGSDAASLASGSARSARPADWPA